MKIGCVENCVFTIMWGFLQSLKKLVEEDKKCRELALSSELGRYGCLIVTCR